MGKVHQENQAKKDEGSGTDKRDVVAPKYEEAVRNEEGYDDKYEPKQNLWSPPTTLM